MVEKASIREHKTCKYCGSLIPVWDDIAAALEEAVTSFGVPTGLRSMLAQAAQELKAERCEEVQYINDAPMKCSRRLHHDGNHDFSVRLWRA